jgi:hypothetical protein
MTTDKLSVTIDKGQKLGHVCQIKKSPHLDTILKPEKEDLSRKSWTYGNPALSPFDDD